MVAAAIKLAAAPVSSHLARIVSGPTSFATLNLNLANRKRESCNINSGGSSRCYLAASAATIVVIYRFDLAVKR